jgi:YkoY family integral membrane protein
MDWEIVYIIVVLVFMEGLLSADNALVLSMMASKIKDPVLQKKALYYGMVGAVAFRAIFILLGTIILKFWIIKVLGALYLAKLAYDHFSKGDGEVDVSKYENTIFHKILGKFGVRLSQFWTIVISIEFMDLAFSIDSITAALALSDEFWVLALGGILGIVMMRFVAGFFIKLIAKVPEMEHTAFVLIAIIAAKMFSGTIHYIVNWTTAKLALFTSIQPTHMHEIHVPHWAFFGLLVLTFGGTFVVSAINKKRGKHDNLAA